MSTITLIQTVGAMSVAAMPVFRAVFTLFAFGAMVLVFRPLITGVLRALLLVVKPRLSKEEKAGRRKMQDAQLLQRMINATSCPGHAAELRAMAARS